MQFINRSQLNLAECQSNLDLLLIEGISSIYPNNSTLDEMFFTFVKSNQLHQAESLFRWMVENKKSLYSIVDYFHQGTDMKHVPDDRFLKLVLGTKLKRYRQRLQYTLTYSTKLPKCVTFDKDRFLTLIQQLQTGDRSDNVINESLQMWHDNKKAQKLPKTLILSIADKSIIELFLGIEFVNDDSYELFKTIKHLINDDKQALPKIQSLFKIYNIKTDSVSKQMMKELYQSTMEKDQLEVFRYFYSTLNWPIDSISKAISNPSDNIVNWALDNMNADCLTSDSYWMICHSSYRNVRVFKKIDNFMDKFREFTGFSEGNQKDTERYLLQKMLFDGSKEVLEHILPMLTQSHNFPSDWQDFNCLNNMDLVETLSDPTKNDKIVVDWSKISPHNCKVGLWLVKNGYMFLTFDNFEPYYQYNSLILDAIQKKDLEFLLTFGIDRLPQALMNIGSFEGTTTIETMDEQMNWLFTLLQENEMILKHLDLLMEFVFDNDYSLFFERLIQSDINIVITDKLIFKMTKQSEMKCFQLGLKYKKFDLPKEMFTKCCCSITKLNDVLKSLSLQQEYQRFRNKLILKPLVTSPTLETIDPIDNK